MVLGIFGASNVSNREGNCYYFGHLLFDRLIDEEKKNGHEPLVRTHWIYSASEIGAVDFKAMYTKILPSTLFVPRIVGTWLYLPFTKELYGSSVSNTSVEKRKGIIMSISYVYIIDINKIPFQSD